MFMLYIYCSKTCYDLCSIQLNVAKEKLKKKKRYANFNKGLRKYQWLLIILRFKYDLLIVMAYIHLYEYMCCVSKLIYLYLFLKNACTETILYCVIQCKYKIKCNVYKPFAKLYWFMNNRLGR